MSRRQVLGGGAGLLGLSMVGERAAASAEPLILTFDVGAAGT